MEQAKPTDKGKSRMASGNPDGDWSKLAEWEFDLDELIRVPLQVKFQSYPQPSTYVSVDSNLKSHFASEHVVSDSTR